MYSVGIVLQCFTIDALHQKLGSKRTHLLGASCGMVVSLLAISLNHVEMMPFICLAIFVEFIDGVRETQFEVIFFVYISENILECTTAEM